jgi:hypothetical protein
MQTPAAMPGSAHPRGRTRSAKTSTCTASIDGVVVLPASPLDASWKPGVPGLQLGFSYVSSQTTAWQARYDNVLFDFQ